MLVWLVALFSSLPHSKQMLSNFYLLKCLYVTSIIVSLAVLKGWKLQGRSVEFSALKGTVSSFVRFLVNRGLDKKRLVIFISAWLHARLKVSDKVFF